MKKCPECGGEYKNLGAHMRKHRPMEEKAEEPEKKRPFNRLKNGGLVCTDSGVIMIQRR